MAKNFWIQLLILALGMSLGVYLYNRYALPELQTNILWVVLVLFVLVTGLTHQIILGAIEKSPGKFVGIYMATTFAKLLFLMVCIVVFALMYKPKAVVVTVGFLVHYLVFTPFEIWGLTKRLRKPD